MKNLVIGLLISVFFLTACGVNPSLTQPTLVSVSGTSTPSPLPTATRTVLPSATPTASTPALAPGASVTPLPTIPTFTPTFDVSTIVTVTPVPKAECPKENLSLVPIFYVPKHPECFDTNQCIFSGTEKEILEFLNDGGSLQAVISRLQNAIYGDYKDYRYQDVTGDSTPELMFIDFALSPNLHIFYCQSDRYKVFTLDPDTSGYMIQRTWIESIADLNSNSLPETILSTRGCSGRGCFVIFTLEWNGDGFSNLSSQVEMWGVTDFKLQDTDNNGTKEIILTGDYPGTGTYSMMVPWRLKIDNYSWDGREYARVSEDFNPPQFRFQAVQDADRYTLEHKYDKALSQYQAAIFSDKLDWWSLEKRIYYVNDLDPWVIDNTPGPPPAPDSTEYPRLAAYAYYRIMLLHLVQGYESDATVVYTTLQQKFGDDPYARPYAEMASAFWEAYQSTQKMYAGCAAAIKYAVEHPEILIPLGSDYHGAQSHTYVPADVCPFR